MDGGIYWVSSLYPDHVHQARSSSFPLSLLPFHQIWLKLGGELRRHEGWAGELTKLYHISTTFLGNQNENITGDFLEAKGPPFDLIHPISHAETFTGSPPFTKTLLASVV